MINANTKIVASYLIAVVLFSYISDVFASSETEGPFYVDFTQPLIVNYQSEGNGFRYLKCKVSVRANDRFAASRVRYHMDALRHHLLMLFSQQSEKDVATTEGKTELRLRALKELQAFLKKEEGNDTIEDLVFTNFLVEH